LHILSSAGVADWLRGELVDSRSIAVRNQVSVDVDGDSYGRRGRSLRVKEQAESASCVPDGAHQKHIFLVNHGRTLAYGTLHDERDQSAVLTRCGGIAGEIKDGETVTPWWPNRRATRRSRPRSGRAAPGPVWQRAQP